MVSFIITGHGNFASGLHSSMKLIVGEQPYVFPIDFTEDLSSDDLKVKINNTINDSDANDIIVLCDLAGGTPFNVSALISCEKPEKNMRVLAGANLAMILDVALSKDSLDLDALVEQAKETGISAIAEFKTKQADTEEVSDDEDGI